MCQENSNISTKVGVVFLPRKSDIETFRFQLYYICH